jgi:cell division protein FtsB
VSRRLIIGILIVLLAALQLRLWVSDGGVIDNQRSRIAVQAETEANQTLSKRNATLEAEVADLRTGGAAIESHARSTLGMVKRGETFYLVVEPNGQPASSTGGAAPAP